MTIYKPIRPLAKAAARIADAFLHGRKFTSATMTPNHAGKVPSIIIPVITVTKANIKSTVIKDGYVKMSELGSACKNLH
jgi:D-xylose transport system substrate-binding protein